jgi:cysteine synthase A
MAQLDLGTKMLDKSAYDRTLASFRKSKIVLPTFAQLADPTKIPEAIRSRLADIDPDAAHPLNLFRVHWFNDASRKGSVSVPEHLVLPESLTGVKAPIVVLFGNRFPMIRAHKVLAAYGCLVPRLISGLFDPTHHRAIWPSTGNYCRGGVAISRILGCRGVAVLPAGMSQERFDWLDKWVGDPSDIIRTPGSESNVKEIYDACAELDKSPDNIIFNQFSEFANYLVHYACTGRALDTAFEAVRAQIPGLTARAFVSATGSAGTIAAGDYLKERHGTKIVAVEATECPTLLYNGFGEHNIQGIGDKHVPYIHNVMNTDFVAGISDQSTDSLGLLFSTEVGRSYLKQRRHVPDEVLAQLSSMGLSSICNVLAAIKTAKYLNLGENDAIMTIATDGAAMYGSERALATTKYFSKGFDAVNAGEVFGQHMLGTATDHLLELSEIDKNRIFNLGYFTWVEQQGVELPEFESRRRQSFWRGLHATIPVWDQMIEAFNRESGVSESA